MTGMKQKQGSKLKTALFMVVLVSMWLGIMSGMEAKAAGESRYAYEISGKAIRRVDLKTGRIKTFDIKSNSEKVTFNSRGQAIEKNGYLYYKINVYRGSDAFWPYICRIKKDGTAFKLLDRGYNLHIAGNKIYYTKAYFNEKSNKDPSYNTFIKDIYLMNLDGSGKKKLIKNKILIGVYGSSIIAEELGNNDSIIEYSTTGVKKKTILGKGKNHYNECIHSVLLQKRYK